jgi:hypothetical protein
MEEHRYNSLLINRLSTLNIRILKIELQDLEPTFKDNRLLILWLPYEGLSFMEIKSQRNWPKNRRLQIGELSPHFSKESVLFFS